MLFQEAPVETTGYMILGFSVIFGTMLIYLISLISRWKNGMKEQDLIAELERSE